MWESVFITTYFLRMLCATFGWTWPCGSGEEIENVKSLQMDRQRMDNSSSQKHTWAFSSGELKTKLIPFLEQTMVGSFLDFSWAFNDSDSVWKVQNKEKIYKQFVICYNQNLSNSCTMHACTSIYHSLGWPKV